MPSPHDDLINQYSALHTRYESFSSRLEALLRDLLDTRSIRRHFSESRAKSLDSLREKINRPGKNYKGNLSSVPDLAGIRIVLYYEDDVPRAGEVIREEFNIVEKEETHQPDGYSPDQFGYLSLHFIISLNEARSALPEWKIYADMKAEIQIRTVLQHSWAAVSHALQYKKEADVPRSLRRKLFRLAGLFELADEEFVAIRDKASTLQAESETALRGDKSLVEIDIPTIISFLADSHAAAQMQETLEMMGFQFDDIKGLESELVEHADKLNLKSMAEIEDLAKNFRLQFFEEIFTDPWIVNRSFVLILAMIDKYTKSFTKNYLKSFGWGDTVIERVLTAAKNK
ncbi:hypothetical protein [Luteolibacter sp. LG18]|uniref:GTP pyrophosphokinase n=1 Tax=Luteolibacter sp. LG18 TaxID=2819286 RepID=UPI002B2ECBFD|nr:hypothetical protein llg_30030 [Luteolibacter sp. LG18]